MWRWLSDKASVASAAVADGVSASVAVVGTAVAGVHTVVSAATHVPSKQSQEQQEPKTIQSQTAASSDQHLTTVTTRPAVSGRASAHTATSNTPAGASLEGPSSGAVDDDADVDLGATVSQNSDEWVDVPDGAAEEWQVLLHGQDEGTHVVVPLRHIEYEDSEEEAAHTSVTARTERDEYEDDLMAHASMSVYHRHNVDPAKEAAEQQQQQQSRNTTPKGRRHTQQQHQRQPRPSQPHIHIQSEQQQQQQPQQSQQPAPEPTTPTKQQPQPQPQPQTDEHMHSSVPNDAEPPSPRLRILTQLMSSLSREMDSAPLRHLPPQPLILEPEQPEQQEQPQQQDQPQQHEDDLRGVQLALVFIEQRQQQQDGGLAEQRPMPVPHMYAREEWQMQLRPQAQARKRRHDQQQRPVPPTKMQAAMQQRRQPRKALRQQQNAFNRSERGSRKF